MMPQVRESGREAGKQFAQLPEKARKSDEKTRRLVRRVCLTISLL
jgi:hypothetical protein